MGKDSLNIRQRRFVNAYIANGGNASKAYKEAGYECSSDEVSDSMACRLINNPKVEFAVNEELLLAEKEARVSFRRKVTWLGDIAEDGMKKAKVISDPESGRVVEIDKMQDSRSSIAAIAELNRMQGHHAAINTNLNIQSVSFSHNIGNPDDLGSDEKPVQGEVVSG